MMNKSRIKKSFENALYDREKAGKHFLQVQVQTPNEREMLITENVVAQIILSKEAMIAWGTELIREGMQQDELYMWEMHPSDPESHFYELGVCMHPRSCLLKIIKEDTGTLAEVMTKEGLEIHQNSLEDDGEMNLEQQGQFEFNERSKMITYLHHEPGLPPIKYQFRSYRSPGSDYEYESEDKDFIQVKVQLPNGDVVLMEVVMVYFTLSTEAMIALGRGLIRAAFLGKEDLWELYPATSQSASMQLGVYMHPKSCLLKIIKEDTGTLNEIFMKEGTPSEWLGPQNLK